MKKKNPNPSPAFRSVQQAQLCFLHVVCLAYARNMYPSIGTFFINQQGSWYFENEVSSITYKGLLSGVCHHTGLEGREGDPSAWALILQDYVHSARTCSHTVFHLPECADQMLRWQKNVTVAIRFPGWVWWKRLNPAAIVVSAPPSHYVGVGGLLAFVSLTL